MSAEDFVFEMDPDVVPAGEFVRVEPGWYEFELTENISIEDSSKGNPMVVTAWRLIGSLDPDVELPTGADGQLFWLNTVLLKDKQRYARALWEAVGLEWGGAMSKDEILAAFRERVGTHVKGLVQDEEYEGEVRSRLRRVAALE